jgi:hypothetical protein
MPYVVVMETLQVGADTTFQEKLYMYSIYSVYLNKYIKQPYLRTHNKFSGYIQLITHDTTVTTQHTWYQPETLAPYQGTQTETVN